MKPLARQAGLPDWPGVDLLALQATGLQTFFENHPPGPRTISARIRTAMHQDAAVATILTGGEAGPGLVHPPTERRPE